VFAERRYDVPRRAAAGEVLDDLALLGAELLRDVVSAIGDGSAVAVPQKGEPTFAPKLTAEDGLVRWDEPAERVANRIRGVTPEPGAHTTLDGARIGILSAYVPDEEVVLPSGEVALRGRDVYVGTGTRAIVVERVQPAGRKAMGAADWRRGIRATQVKVGT